MGTQGSGLTHLDHMGTDFLSVSHISINVRNRHCSTQTLKKTLLAALMVDTQKSTYMGTQVVGTNHLDPMGTHVLSFSHISINVCNRFSSTQNVRKHCSQQSWSILKIVHTVPFREDAIEIHK